jgi:sugar lactone lactonase YvrE
MKRTLVNVGGLCALISVCSVVSFASQPLTKIQLNGPERIALDSSGNLYVYESYGRRIVRLRLKDNKVDVVAGNGRECCYREGVLAKNTAIYDVYSLAVDPDGNIYIGGRNTRDYAFVRIIDAKSGRIRTIANGRMPSPATGVELAQADLSDPEGLAVIPGGGLLVTASQSDLVAE